MSLTDEILEMLDSNVRDELKLRLVRVMLENNPDLEPVPAVLDKRDRESVVPTKVLRDWQDQLAVDGSSDLELFTHINGLINHHARLVHMP